MKQIQRAISFLLALVLVVGMVPPVAVRADETEPTQAVTEVIAETTVPTEAATEPVEETTVPTEAVTEPVVETTAPTEAVTEPVEETTVPTEAVTEPAVEQETAGAQAMAASTVASGTCGDNLTWTLDDAGILTVSGTGRMINYPYAWSDYQNQIRRVRIGEDVTSIGDQAFRGCTALTDVKLHDNITKIGYGAFGDCDSLTSITIPAGTNSVSDTAFQRCDKLTKILVEAGNKNYCNDEYGVLYTKDMEWLVQAPGAISGSYLIPDGVVYISEGAFSECISLTEVTLPESVSHIYTGAFYESGLKSIVIPESVVLIDMLAFSGCESLTTITMDGDAPAIYDEALAGVTATVYYPAGNTSWTKDVMQQYGGTITWEARDVNKAIIVLPGIAGSNIYTSQEVNTKDYLSDLADEFMLFHKYHTYKEGYRLWEPTSNTGTVWQKLDKQNEIQSEILMLRCTEEGEAIVPTHTNKPRNDIYGATNAYKKLLTALVSTFGSEYDVNLFSYDWRMDNAVSAKKLEDYINKQQYSSVILVCHSMGGLVASEYLRRSSDNQAKVDKLITLGTPYLGAPKALYVLETGNFMGDEKDLVLATPLKLICGNVYGIHQLLPCEKYFSMNDTTYVEYYNNKGLWGKHTEEKLNYEDTYSKLSERSWATKASGEVKSMYTTANDLYERLFTDDGHIIDAVDSYVIIGYGHDTILELRQEYNKDGSYESCVDITVLNGGDGTVPLISANIGGLTPEGRTYYINEGHSYIQKNKDVIDLVENIINCKPNDFASSITKTLPESIEEDKIKLKIECPVDLTLLDENGNEWAYVSNNILYNENSDRGTVYVLGKNNDTKIAYLNGTDNQILLTGTGEGEMTYTVSKMENGTEVERIVFDNVPITPDTVIHTSDDIAEGICLEVDEDGDGGVDQVLEPDRHLEGSEIEDADAHYHSFEAPVFEWNEDHIACNAVFSCVAGDASESVACTVEADVSEAEQGISRYTASVVYYGETYSNDVIVYSLKDFTVPQYIAMDLLENNTYQLTANVKPEGLSDAVRWSLEEATNVIELTENGEVTARNVGTAYVIASVTDGENTTTARCRIDVAAEDTEKPGKINIQGIQLSTTNVTSELYSADYAQFDLLLQLPQNVSIMSTEDRVIPENKGVAIEEAWFAESGAKAAFDLVPLDDRRIAIVPTEDALENPLGLAKNYKSQVTVVVDGTEYTTAEGMNVTLKQSLPKLKATIPAFNAFYTGQSQKIAITGGTVTDIAGKEIPEWLTLNGDGTLSLNEKAGTKNSGKAVLLVDTKEWIIPAEVSLSVKNTYKAPGLKLSASSVKMAANAADSSGVALKLLPKSEQDTLSGLNVQGVTVGEGFKYRVENFNPDTGELILKAENGFQTGTIVLNVSFSDTREILPLNLKVTTQTVSLKLAPASVTLNKSAGDKAQIKITATPADYRVIALNITGNEGGFFKTSYENDILTILSTDAAEAGKTYGLSLSTGNSKPVTLKVKVTEDVPTVTLKAKSGIDLSFPEQTVSVVPAFKNYAGGEIADYTAKVTAADGTVSDAFTVSYENGAFLVECRDTDIVTGTYRLYLTLKLKGNVTLETDAKLTVKRTAVKLKLSPGSLTLNKMLGDRASVAVTCTTKGYDFSEQPIWELKAKNKKDSAEGKLDIKWEDNKLQIAVNDATEPGTTYNLQVRVNKHAPVANLAIKIVDVLPTVSLKANGTVDVIRDGTSVLVTPTYKNCMDLPKSEKLNVYSSADKFTEPVEGLFHIERDDFGRFVLTAEPGLDHTKTYKVELESTVSGITVKSAKISVKVKMGSAKLTVKTADTILFADDKYDRAQIWLEAKDADMNNVARIEFKNAKQAEQFEIVKYSDGHYAIGFKSNNVDESLIGKTVTVALNVFIEGNQSAKANTTASVKLTIVQ